MDSLSFRNQQLAKRVELLQEELAASEAKGKKGKVIMRGNYKGIATQSCTGWIMYFFVISIKLICQQKKSFFRVIMGSADSVMIMTKTLTFVEPMS